MSRIHIGIHRPLPWWRFLALAWSLFFGMYFAPHFMPGWFWLEVDDVFVHDTIADSTPKMTVERTIHRPFVGFWAVNVKREGNNGFSFACGSSGTIDYQPDVQLPDPLTLDWWTYPIPCNLGPGRYRVDTTWTIDLQGGAEKTIRKRSNVFSVFPTQRAGK